MFGRKKKRRKKRAAQSAERTAEQAPTNGERTTRTLRRGGATDVGASAAGDLAPKRVTSRDVRRWVVEQARRETSSLSDDQLVVNYVAARMLRSFVRDGPGARVLDAARKAMREEIGARAEAGDLPQAFINSVNAIEAHPRQAEAPQPSPAADDDAAPPPPKPKPRRPAPPATQVIDAKGADAPTTEKTPAPTEKTPAAPEASDGG